MYMFFQVPALIVYGEKDTVLGQQSLKNLKNIPNSKDFVMKDGGHSAYMDKPDEFHLYLYNFLEDVTPKTT